MRKLDLGWTHGALDGHPGSCMIVETRIASQQKEILSPGLDGNCGPGGLQRGQVSNVIIISEFHSQRNESLSCSAREAEVGQWRI